jgi:hypothetical protein
MFVNANVPSFCSLEPSAYQARLAEFMALMLRYEGRVVRTGRETRLRFAAVPGLREELTRLAALERDCCSSFDFAIKDQDGEVSFDVSGWLTAA